MDWQRDFRWYLSNNDEEIHAFQFRNVNSVNFFLCLLLRKAAGHFSWETTIQNDQFSDEG